MCTASSFGRVFRSWRRQRPFDQHHPHFLLLGPGHDPRVVGSDSIIHLQNKYRIKYEEKQAPNPEELKIG